MSSARRAISNLGDVQIALNDIFTTLENLTSKPLDLNKRIITGIPDPKVNSDAVNLIYLQKYIAAQIDALTKTLKKPEVPADAPTVVFGKSIVPKLNNTYDIGSSSLKWAKGYFADALTALSLSITNGITAATLGLTGTLTGVAANFSGAIAGLSAAITNGITAATLNLTGTLTGVAANFSGAVAGLSITATNALTGATLSTSGNAAIGGNAAITGTVSASNLPASIPAKTSTGTFTTGLKLTGGGVNGSVTINADGTLTFTSAT